MATSFPLLTPIPHKSSRIYTSHPGSKYLYPSDKLEITRLTLQHRVLKEAWGGKILLAPVCMQEGDEVLDSGCGPGIWLLELAHSLPSLTKLMGIDVESTVFPSPDCFPGNVQFMVANIVQLPPAWNNRFQLVHQRLLVGALLLTEWPKALEEMYRVLKPGGWVQLTESGEWHSGPATKEMAQIRLALGQVRGLLTDFGRSIPEMLSNAGFINIQVDPRSTPLGEWAGEHGKQSRDNMISLFRGMKSRVLDDGGYGLLQSEEDFDRLVHDVEKEWDETPGSRNFWIVYNAQKPPAEL